MTARTLMTNTAPINGQIPPYLPAALLVALAIVGRLDSDMLAALGTAAGILSASKDLLKPNP
jgi:hypothetical protein